MYTYSQGLHSKTEKEQNLFLPMPLLTWLCCQWAIFWYYKLEKGHQTKPISEEPSLQFFTDYQLVQCWPGALEKRDILNPNACKGNNETQKDARIDSFLFFLYKCLTIKPDVYEFLQSLKSKRQVCHIKYTDEDDPPSSQKPCEKNLKIRGFTFSIFHY